MIDRVLVDPAGEKPLGELEDRPARCARRLGGMVHGTKRDVADGILNSEVRRISREVLQVLHNRPAVEEEGDLAEPVSPEQVEDAVAELLACFPVYRSYLPEGREHLEHALAEARRHRPDLAEVLDAIDAGPLRRRRAGRAALPADQRHGDGQGCRGLRVLPLGAADVAQRGRRRPERLLRGARRVPRRDAPAAGRLAARHDRVVDPRHQARRGRPRPDQRPRRDARPVGARRSTGCSRSSRCPTPASAACCGRRSSAPGRRAASGCTPTPRRRCARPGTAPSGPRPTRSTRPRSTPPSTPPSTTPRCARSSTTSLTAVAGPGWSNALAAKLHHAHRARRARRLPGQRAVGAEPGRPRQPAPGRLRRARRAAQAAARRRAAAARRRPSTTTGAVKLLLTHVALTARREHPDLFDSYDAADRDRRRRRPRAGLRPWRRRHRRHPAARSGWPPAAAGATPACRSPPASGWTC